MGFGKKLVGWFTENPDEEYEDGYDENDFEVNEVKTSIFEDKSSQKASDVVRALNANKDSQVVLFEPRSYSEAQDIANQLKQRRATVINLHRLQKEQAKRVIDFLTGVIFAVDGDIQQIGPKVFLCAPKNIGVAGGISMEDGDNE